MIGEKTELTMPLTGNATSEDFSVRGCWRLQTFGFFVGDLLLQERENEGDQWRSKRRWHSYGEIHPYDPRNPIHDEVSTADDATVKGRNVFYRFIYTPANIVRRHTAIILKNNMVASPPRMVFTAESLIFDP